MTIFVVNVMLMTNAF